MSKRCEKCGHELFVDHEMICYQLRFIGSTIGHFQDKGVHPSDDDFMALQCLLYDLADKVYPAGRMPEEGD